MEQVADAGNSTTTIPDDLIVEILSRLPAKSIIRFQSVSKQWFSIIQSKDLANTFLSRSKTRPRLLLALEIITTGDRFFFSVPEHNTNEKTSTSISRHDMTQSTGLYYYYSSCHVNGFVCFTSFTCIVSSTGPCESIIVFNPITRQTVKLPDIQSNGRKVYEFLGYDPVEDQYKVLCVVMYGSRDNQHEYYVCRVSSSEKQEWRKIENTTTVDNYHFVYQGICIDGSIYYTVGESYIVRFDVRSEKMELIEAPEESFIATSSQSTLVNYNGRLGGVDFDRYTAEINLCVLEDVENQEWSSVTFKYSCEWIGFGYRLESKGLIHTGELLAFQRINARKPFCVYYYDFNKESARKVEIPGVETGELDEAILCYPGYVENIRFL